MSIAGLLSLELDGKSEDIGFLTRRDGMSNF